MTGMHTFHANAVRKEKVYKFKKGKCKDRQRDSIEDQEKLREDGCLRLCSHDSINKELSQRATPLDYLSFAYKMSHSCTQREQAHVS